MSLAEI